MRHRILQPRSTCQLLWVLFSIFAAERSFPRTKGDLRHFQCFMGFLAPLPRQYSYPENTIFLNNLVGGHKFYTLLPNIKHSNSLTDTGCVQSHRIDLECKQFYSSWTAVCMKAYGQPQHNTISAALCIWLNTGLNRWNLPQQQQDASQLMGRIRYVRDKMQSFHFPQITPKTRDQGHFILSSLLYHQKCDTLWDNLWMIERPL